jgi:hypothetical protein
MLLHKSAITSLPHTFAITILPSHFCHHNFAITLSPSHFCHHNFAITLLPSQFRHHTFAITILPSHFWLKPELIRAGYTQWASYMRVCVCLCKFVCCSAVRNTHLASSAHSPLIYLNTLHLPICKCVCLCKFVLECSPPYTSRFLSPLFAHYPNILHLPINCVRQP